MPDRRNQILNELRGRGLEVQEQGGRSQVRGLVQPSEPSPQQQQRGARESALGLMPSAKERERFIDGVASLQRLQLLKKTFNPGFVGPLEGRLGTLKSVANFITPKEAAFRTLTTDFQNRFIKFLTGANLSEAEADRIIRGIPNLKMSDTQFRAAVDVAEKNIMDEIKILSSSLAGMGMRLPPVELPSGGEQQTKQPSVSKDLENIPTDMLIERLRQGAQP